MLTYLHGDDTFSSRHKLNLLLKDFLRRNPQGKTLKIEKEGFNLVTVKALIKNISLFEEKRLFLLEEPRKFTPTQRKEILQLLCHSSGTEIIAWDSQSTRLGREFKKYSSQFQEFHFPQPKTMFKFLEAIHPGNQRIFLPLFQRLIEKQPLELVFYFLKKHCHNLIVVSAQKNSFPSWQRQRLFAQLKRFPLKEIIRFYRQLIDLEYANKTGRLEVDLELPLVNLLATL